MRIRRQKFHNTDKVRIASPLLLFLGITSFAALSCLIYFLPPEQSITLYQWQFKTYYVSFPLLFLFIYSVVTLFFHSKTHGILIGLFACVYLGFRLAHLTDPFFLIVLLAILLTLELIFSRNKKRKEVQKEETRQIQY